MIAVLVVIFVIGVFIVMVAREQKGLVGKRDKYPEGHFIALGLVFGICVGLPLGVLVGNIAFGPAIGLAAGLLIGGLIEDKKRKMGMIRMLTKKERIDERVTLKMILIVMLSILVIVSATAVILGVS